MAPAPAHHFCIVHSVSRNCLGLQIVFSHPKVIDEVGEHIIVVTISTMCCVGPKTRA